MPEPEINERFVRFLRDRLRIVNEGELPSVSIVTARFNHIDNWQRPVSAEGGAALDAWHVAAGTVAAGVHLSIQQSAGSAGARYGPASLLPAERSAGFFGAPC